MIRRVLAAVLILAVAAALGVMLWPQLLGLEHQAGFAQIVSLRAICVCVALVATVILAFVALVARPARRLFGALAIVFLAFCVGSIAVLGARGFSSGPAAASKPTGAVTVLSWNTEGDAPGAAEIARVALASKADVVTLPETTGPTATAVAKIMGAAGNPMWVHFEHFDLISKSRSTSLLISTRLGNYAIRTDLGNTRVLPSVIAPPTDGSGPTIVAVHAVSPKPRQMRNWRADLTFLSSLCAGRDLFMAGDFNSTMDHLGPFAKSGADFGGCRDSGLAGHDASVGSWPTSLPPLLGAQIDHVMFTPAWRLASTHVIVTEDRAGSDHRPVVATLVPAG